MWDGAISRQSNRTDEYRNYVDRLQEQDFTFFCTCARKDLDKSLGCVRNCQRSTEKPDKPHAIRAKANFEHSRFDDRILGEVQSSETSGMRNFSIYRKDDIPTYPLAVVIDDHLDHITDVVRGADLLLNTHEQIFLIQKLGFSQPHYAHHPVLNERGGIKLSKRTKATAIDERFPIQNLTWSLQLLGLDPPKLKTVDSLLHWATSNWLLAQVQPDPYFTNYESI